MLQNGVTFQCISASAPCYRVIFTHPLLAPIIGIMGRRLVYAANPGRGIGKVSNLSILCALPVYNLPLLLFSVDFVPH